MGSIRIRSSYTGKLKPEDKVIDYFYPSPKNPNPIFITKGKRKKEKKAAIKKERFKRKDYITNSFIDNF